jgi:phage minor structural protein
VIPILFSATQRSFTTGGTILSECMSCKAIEEENGVFECEMQYPVYGRHYREITLGKIIWCKHDDSTDKQPFVIYRKKLNERGVETVNAYHLAYTLKNVVVEPYTATYPTGAISGIRQHALNDCEFTFHTDLTNTSEMEVSRPATGWDVLRGSSGSVLDTFGGILRFDNQDVYLTKTRGRDTAHVIQFGKNIKTFSREISNDDLYNAIYGYWSGTEIVKQQDPDTGEYKDVEIPAFVSTGRPITVVNNPPSVIIPTVMDFSDEYETKPAGSTLVQRALKILNDNHPWEEFENVELSVVQTANAKVKQDYRLCDTVTIVYPEIGLIKTDARIVRTVYDVLAERMESIEVGTPKKTFIQTKKKSSTGALHIV